MLDVISVQEKFSRAVAYAVGDAVLCESLDEARQLAYHSGGERFKVVTLDGSLINKAGLMTGGSSFGEQARANKWDQKEYTGLKEKYESLAREVSSLASSHAAEEKEQALRHQVQSKQQELSTAQADLDLTCTKEAKHRKELTTISANLEQGESQLAKLQQEKSREEAAVTALQVQCDRTEDKIFAPFSKSLGVASVREYEDKMLHEAKEQEEQLQALKSHQAKLRSQLQFEQTKDLPAAVRKLSKQIADDDKALERLAAAQAKSEKATEALKQESGSIEKEVRWTCYACH